MALRTKLLLQDVLHVRYITHGTLYVYIKCFDKQFKGILY